MALTWSVLTAASPHDRKKMKIFSHHASFVRRDAAG